MRTGRAGGPGRGKEGRGGRRGSRKGAPATRPPAAGRRPAPTPARPGAAGPRFLLHDATGEGWPKIRLPQVAFAGRSNVGKSSLLNALAGREGLARVSRDPGRTRGLVFFEIESRFAFVDLPGYGYAKVSREEREAWQRLVEGYLSACPLLKRVYLLVDLRRGPEEEEEMLAGFLADRGVPHRFVATKADKLTTGERARVRGHFSGPAWAATGGPPLVVSARTGEGIDLLWRDIRASLSSPRHR